MIKILHCRWLLDVDEIWLVFDTEVEMRAKYSLLKLMKFPIPAEI